MAQIARKWISLPIEVAARELDAKALVAAEFCKRGFGVIIGKQQALQKNISNLPPCIYLVKSIARFEFDYICKLKERGVRVINLDEEGIIYLNEEQFIATRYSEKLVPEVSAFFAWGKIQAEVLRRRFPHSANRVWVTGNPRMDFYRKDLREFYADKVNDFNSLYGDYVLIPSNFSPYNFFTGKDGFLAHHKKMNRRNPHDHSLEFYAGYVEYVGKIYHAFQSLIAEISESFPGRHIIVRPHPSENHSSWQKFAEQFDNVHCIYECSAAPWIIGADTVIHNSCTTGIEAFLANKNVIAYQPFKSAVYDLDLPNSLSLASQDALEVFQFIESGMTQSQRLSRDSLVEPVIDNYRGPPSYSRVVSIVQELAQDLEPSKLESFNGRSVLDRLKLIHGSYRSVRAYQEQKTLGIDPESIGSALRAASILVGGLDLGIVEKTEGVYMVWTNN